jgi:hypothetical protein
MMTMENSPERADIVAKMNRILIDDCVVASVFNPAIYVLIQPWAKRVVRNALVAKGNGFKYSWIDAPMREIEREKLNRKDYWPLAVSGLLLATIVWLGIRRRARSNV